MIITEVDIFDPFVEEANEIAALITKIRFLSEYKNALLLVTLSAGTVHNSEKLSMTRRTVVGILARQQVMEPVWASWRLAEEKARQFVQFENARGRQGQAIFELIFKEHYDRVYGLLTETYPMGYERLEVVHQYINLLIRSVETNIEQGYGK